MSTFDLDPAYTQEVLDSCARRTGVAGAQLSVITPHLSHQGRVDVAHGLADASTGRAMDVGSRSQVGSFAKVLTAVLVHQLVDEGRLTLSSSVVGVASGFGETWPGLDGVEVGQLLAMTSGLDTGIWTAGATVAEALEPQLRLPRRTTPGTSFGYTFAATLVAARLVELLRGASWSQSVTDRIATPLGLRLTAESNVADVCPTHELAPGGWTTSPPPTLPGMGPTGTTLVSSAADLARVTEAMCTDLLTDGSRAALHRPVVPVGALMVADAWGHGAYSRLLPDGRRLHGHGGRWAGGVCDVTWEAATGTVVALTTNTPSRGGALVLEVSREVHRRLWGEAAFLEQEPVATPHDLDALEGTYVTADRRYDVLRLGGRLSVRATPLPRPDAVFWLPAAQLELHAVGERRFLPVHETLDEHRLQEVWFSAEERPEFLYDGFVGARRASATTAASAAGS